MAADSLFGGTVLTDLSNETQQLVNAVLLDTVGGTAEVSTVGAGTLVVGTGGVGCAIAASLAGVQVAAISLFDVNTAACEALAERLRQLELIRLAAGDIVITGSSKGVAPGTAIQVSK